MFVLILQVSRRFLFKAINAGLPAVQWVIKLDPRCTSDRAYCCKQVALLRAGHPSTVVYAKLF